VKSGFLQPKSDDELEQYLLSVWSSVDTADSGRLSVAQMSQALRDADLGLNRVQVHSIVGEAAVDPDDGLADYISYVPKASGIVSRLLNREAQMQRYEAVQKLGEEAARMPMDFEAELTKAVEARDPEGTGYVHISDILQVLTSGELPIELGDYEINALLSATDPDEDGNLFYPEWLAFAPELLQYLMEDTALYQ